MLCVWLSEWDFYCLLPWQSKTDDDRCSGEWGRLELQCGCIRAKICSSIFMIHHSFGRLGVLAFLNSVDLNPSFILSRIIHLS